MALVVAFFAAIVFVSGLKFPFMRDDRVAILENSRVTSADGILEIPTTHFWAGAKRVGGLYRPVPMASFYLNYRLGEADVFWFRIVNVLLHATVAVVVVWFAGVLGFGRFAAFLAGSLFALHPLHVEVIQEIKGREEILSALFSMLAIGVAIRVKGALGAISCGFLLVLAVFSKESAIGAVGVVAALPWLFPRRGESGARRVVFGAPAVAAIGAILVFVVVRWLVLGSSVGLAPSMIPRLDNPLAHVDGPVRMISALDLLARATCLLFFPVRLSPDYSLGAIPVLDSFSSAGPIIGGAILLGLVAYVAYRWNRRGGGALVATFCLLSYLPISNLLIPTGTTLGDRLLYVPSAPWAIAVAGCVAAGLGSMRWRGLFFALACGSFSQLTIDWIDDWRSEEVLYRRALEVVPNSARVQASVAYFDLERGNLDEAKERAEIAIGIHPDYGKAHSILGVVYQRRRRPERARVEFEKVLSCENPAASDYLNLAASLFFVGPKHYAEAESLLFQAVDLDSSLVPARILIARIARASGRLDDAWAQLSRVLAQTPGDTEVLAELVEIFEELALREELSGRLEKAEGLRRRAWRARDELRRLGQDSGP